MFFKVLYALFGWMPFIGEYFKPPPMEILPAKDFPPSKVAIIGGGVGGCAAAYFIRELCGDPVDIHVFNDSQTVGGRCAVSELDGNTYECGAQVLHRSHQYMINFKHKFGLREYDSSKMPTAPSAIFNGKKFVLHLGFSKPWNIMKLLWNYGLSFLKMLCTVNSTLKTIANVYNLQAKGVSFKTVPEMIKAMGGDRFFNEIQMTAEQYFKHEKHFNSELVDGVVCAAMKCSYGQNNQSNFSSAIVSLSAIESTKLWRVIGGNYQIPVKLLEASNASYHVAKVTSVTKEGDGSYLLQYQSLESSKNKRNQVAPTTSSQFDVVIIAHPLNSSKVQFLGFREPIYTNAAKTPYHRIVATFIKGNPNAKFFGYSNGQYPRDYPLFVITNDMIDPPVNFDLYTQVLPTTMKEEEAKEYHKPLRDLPTQVYLVLSNAPLTESDRSKMFSSIESIAVKEWPAGYPESDPPEVFPPFVLDDDGGLFYINGIEKVASCMEFTAIGAKNISLLTKEYILRKKKRL